MMRTLNTRVLVLLAAVTLIVGTSSLLAQEAKTPEAKTAQGSLMRVDTTAQTLAIQTQQGSLMEFRYTNETKVIGADQSVAGLATMAGAEVIVQFLPQEKGNVATQIEIRSKT